VQLITDRVSSKLGQTQIVEVERQEGW